MPSAKKTTTSVPKSSGFQAFWPLLLVVFIIWVVYRTLFDFPVWFDESIGKAIFFGLPVWLFVTMTGFTEVPGIFQLSKLRVGLLRGLTIGGLFGFTASIVLSLQGRTFQTVPLFLASSFWVEFFLAILTSFWETLFFFGWVQLTLNHLYPRWPALNRWLLTAVIFTAFHLPNAFLRFGWQESLGIIMLLFWLAFGQALLNQRWKNGYTLVLTQALWGLVLVLA